MAERFYPNDICWKCGQPAVGVQCYFHDGWNYRIFCPTCRHTTDWYPMMVDVVIAFKTKRVRNMDPYVKKEDHYAGTDEEHGEE